MITSTYTNTFNGEELCAFEDPDAFSTTRRLSWVTRVGAMERWNVLLYRSDGVQSITDEKNWIFCFATEWTCAHGDISNWYSDKQIKEILPPYRSTVVMFQPEQKIWFTTCCSPPSQLTFSNFRIVSAKSLGFFP
jgi:hypothetical protein